MAGWLGRIANPLRGYRLLRRLLAEQRAQRRALERIADAVELGQQGAAPRAVTGGQSFRSFAHVGPLGDPEVKSLTSVEYVDNGILAEMLAREDELRAILGRDPTEAEIEAAYDGRRG